MQGTTNKGCLAAVGVLLCLPFCLWLPARLYMDYRFETAVEGRLQRAAKANTVEQAAAELGAAVTEIEARGLTAGNTGIFLQRPENDLGFWHANLKAALDELHKLPPGATPLEKTNVLMKLRETLLNHGEKGDRVNAPDSVAVYPNVLLWTLAAWVVIIIGAVGVVLVVIDLELAG